MECNYPVNALEIEQEMLDDFKEEIRTMLWEFKDDIRKMLEAKA